MYGDVKYARSSKIPQFSANNSLYPGNGKNNFYRSYYGMEVACSLSNRAISGNDLEERP